MKNGIALLFAVNRSTSRTGVTAVRSLSLAQILRPLPTPGGSGASMFGRISRMLLCTCSFMTIALLALGLSNAQAMPGIDTWWGNSGINAQASGGLFSKEPRGVAFDNASADVYVADTENNRIQRFGGDGAFIAAWGKDVDASNPSTGYEICQAPVGAEADHCQKAGTGGLGGEFSGPAGVAVDQSTHNVYVVDPGNKRVQEFSAEGAFIRAFGKNVVQTGKPGDAGNGFEICEVAADCQAGEAGAGNGALASPGYPAVARAGSPNAGDVLIADAGNKRVSEFKANGEFVRAFGWDVAAAGPGNTGTGFEVCTAAGGDTCQAGSAGSGVGQFAAATPTRVAEDTTGRIYTVEPTGNFRVQRFTLPANVPTPQGEFAVGSLHGAVDNPFPPSPKDNTTEIAVDDAGNVYAVKAFRSEPTVAEKALLEAQGSPPVVVENANGPVSWQQRILRIDPASEAVDAIMVANPGTVATIGFENVDGLAVGAGGTPLYAMTTVPNGKFFSGLPRTRVWRLNEIAGPSATNVHAEGIGSSTATLKAVVTPAQVTAVKRLESAYRFEYSEDGVSWTAAPGTNALIGDGSDGGTSSTCPTPQAANCEVSQSIAGLTPNTTYQVRLATYSQFDKGQTKTIVGTSFTTVPKAPATTTGAASWSSPADTEPSLFLGGTVNPGNDASTYQFQYVDNETFQVDVKKAEEEGRSPAEIAEAGFSHATPMPVVPASAGKGLETGAVHVVLAGLDPSLTYDYRLVASNSVGTTKGVERSVAPPTTNQRFYELVSAGQSWGMGVEFNKGEAVAAGGDRARFGAQTFGEDPRSVPSFLNQYVSERSSAGWGVAETSPPGERSQSEGNLMWAAGQGKALMAVGSLSERERSEAQFAFTNLDGSLTMASPQLVPLARAGHGFYTLLGASADLSTYVFGFVAGSTNQANVALLPGEPLVGNGVRTNLYEITGAGGPSPTALAILNRADGAGGAIIGGVCGAAIGMAPHPVSSDGSIVYFSVFPGAPASGACSSPGPQRLYKRIDNETTVEVSAPQCTPTPACPESTAGDDTLAGASADGQVAFFTTVRRLVNADTDSTSDLYAYDENPPAGQPKLVQVSAGETVGAHTAGSGAKVLGVLDSAEDGSRTYFVAEGVLTGANGAGNSPVSGGRNLYVWERDVAHPIGRIAFIGGLATGDSSEWREGENKQARALPNLGDGSGDGHALLFSTTVKLVTADLDSSRDVYLYNDSAAPGSALTCLTCAGNGSFEARLPLRSFSSGGLTQPDYAEEQPVASADLSTVVFATQEKLSSADENITWDAYAWHEGTVELISKGSEQSGISSGFEQVAISPDGMNVFFATATGLVGSDTNGAFDLYDARMGGGFPEAARAVDCEEEAGCRSPSLQALPTPPGPGSNAPGPGNQPAPAPCKKGKMRKGGKCVKKPSHHKKGAKSKHHHKRASHHRGARG